MSTVKPPVHESRPVLIVGGGPVGLTAALLLAKYDIPTIVFERRQSRSEAPRAHVMNPRSMEILRAFSFDVPRMIAAAASPDDAQRSFFDWKTTGRQFGSLPFEDHDDTHTPYPRISLAQPDFEKILLDEVAQTPLIDLRIGHSVMDLVSSSDAAVATVETSGGETYEMSGDYALACDGAHSPARERLGIGMHGQPDVQPCLMIHFEGSLREITGNRPGLFFWAVGATLPGLFIAYDTDHQWVYSTLFAPPEVPSVEEAKAIVFDALGTEADIEIKHVVPWTMTAQVADDYRSGRIFLVGDAAHRFPPTGGLGLNTGIADAHNLAWKIKVVRDGQAQDRLLDSYDAERRPVAEANTAHSLTTAGAAIGVLTLAEDAPQTQWDDAIEKVWPGLNSLALQIGYSYGGTPAPHTDSNGFVPRAECGDRLPHAWGVLDGAKASSLTLLDPLAFTLLTGSENGWNPDELGEVPVTTVRIDSMSGLPTAWLELTGLDGAGALLVRPDGHILARVDDDSQTSRGQLARSLEVLTHA